MDELMHGPLDLSNETLAELPDGVARPTYDRSRLSPGIVHIGVGNFHRAHQAWYLHRLMQAGKAQDWAIIGAGVRPYDEEQRKKLAGQDYLTTLIELGPKGASAEVVGSMIGFVPVETGHGALIRQMSDPAIRIVSLTVTEGGYYLDPATKAFDAGHEDILYDVAHLDAPRTAFGAIVAALVARRAAGHGPFTVQSCDNLPGNGMVTRNVVVGFANLVSPALGDWVEANVCFPNSMVDCIVPATGPRERELAREFNLSDVAPVTHENFRQWVIEDDFSAGRPPWEEIGVTITDQVHHYEAMKLRLLNGGHQVIAAPGEILGLSTIAQTMTHPGVHGLFRKLCLEEIGPHVAPVPGMTPAAYVDLIEERFSNPAIHDTVRRVAFDGSSRHTGALFPVIREAIAANAPIQGLALSQALWARMCAGTREDGSQIEPNDPVWEELTEAAKAARSNPRVWLEQRQFYGDVADDARFSDAFTAWLSALYAEGTEAVLARYIKG